MATLPSFAKYYWAAWLGASCVYFSTTAFAPLRTNLGWFTLVTGLGGVYVFHFELGRVLGYLKTHCPDQFAKLPQTRNFDIFAFFHPALLRTFLPGEKLPLHACTTVFAVYRSAWCFCAFSLVFVLVLANVLQ